MTCPYAGNGVLGDVPGQDGRNVVSEDGGMIYGDYLKLGSLLNSQELASEQNDRLVHDEHLFIITHQAFELWFKQIIWEIRSVNELFSNSYLDESNALLISTRLGRVGNIMKLLVDQFPILETMTPLDFMDFRGYLAPASGFQSLQFRTLENILGTRQEWRVKYNQQHYKHVFQDDESLKQLEKSTSEPTLLEVVEGWLSRTPGLEAGEFHFWEKYKAAALQYVERKFHYPAMMEEHPQRKQTKMDEYEKEKETFESIFDEDIYNQYVSRGERRMSHKAFQGAMMISLYRDEPRFHQPFQLLTQLMDIDSLLTKWRHTHVMMVQRMLGSKSGTGGSSGYQYLRSTVSDRYKIFLDLFNLSTYLLPREYIPQLSSNMKRRLSVPVANTLPLFSPPSGQPLAKKFVEDSEDHSDNSVEM